jgi:hypothetical protein
MRCVLTLRLEFAVRPGLRWSYRWIEADVHPSHVDEISQRRAISYFLGQTKLYKWLYALCRKRLPFAVLEAWNEACARADWKHRMLKHVIGIPRALTEARLANQGGDLQAYSAIFWKEGEGAERTWLSTDERDDPRAKDCLARMHVGEERRSVGIFGFLAWP